MATIGKHGGYAEGTIEGIVWEGNSRRWLAWTDTGQKWVFTLNMMERFKPVVGDYMFGTCAVRVSSRYGELRQVTKGWRKNTEGRGRAERFFKTKLEVAREGTQPAFDRDAVDWSEAFNDCDIAESQYEENVI